MHSSGLGDLVASVMMVDLIDDVFFILGKYISATCGLKTMLYPQIGFGFGFGYSEERMTFVFACSRILPVPSLDRINISTIKQSVFLSDYIIHIHIR